MKYLIAHLEEYNIHPATSIAIAPVNNTSDLLSRSWNWDPWVLVPLALGLVIYFSIAGLQFNKKTLLFLSGNLVFFLALVSPIATIGETYLFSVHMVQHLLLELIAVPLLLLGLPAKVAAWPMKWKPFRRLAEWLGHPLRAWLIGVGTLWIWHWPALYNLTLEKEWIHALEHICFVLSATVFWYGLFTPLKKHRFSALAAILYLFSACFINSLLAILLTFAPPGLYPYYLQPADPLGALQFIREVWGMLPWFDQQMGGALMWVLGGAIFLLVLIRVLAHWYGEEEKIS